MEINSLDRGAARRFRYGGVAIFLWLLPLSVALAQKSELSQPKSPPARSVASSVGGSKCWLYKLSAKTQTFNPNLFSAYVDWRCEILTDPENCGQGCDLTSLDADICKEIKDCNSRCKSSALAKPVPCKRDDTETRLRNVARQERKCISECSPFHAVEDLNLRAQYVLKKMQGIFSDLEQDELWADFAKERQTLPQQFLCINTEKENVELEPMEVVDFCNSSAVGLGQVTATTFKATFGLNYKKLWDACKGIPIKNLVDNCKGLDAHHFRKAVYGAYEDLTPEQLFENRTLDVDLQLRGSVAAFLNHYLDHRKNWNKAWNGYYGVGEEGGHFTSIHKKRIDRCIARHSETSDPNKAVAPENSGKKGSVK